MGEASTLPFLSTVAFLTSQLQMLRLTFHSEMHPCSFTDSHDLFELCHQSRSAISVKFKFLFY